MFSITVPNPANGCFLIRCSRSRGGGYIIAIHPRSQVLFCLASISLQTYSWMARLVKRLQRCNSAYSPGRFWMLSSKTQFPFKSKFKPIPATLINIIQVWQFRIPLLLPRGPPHLLPVLKACKIFPLLCHCFTIINVLLLWKNTNVSPPSTLFFRLYQGTRQKLLSGFFLLRGYPPPAPLTQKKLPLAQRTRGLSSA